MGKMFVFFLFNDIIVIINIIIIFIIIIIMRIYLALCLIGALTALQM